MAGPGTLVQYQYQAVTKHCNGHCTTGDGMCVAPHCTARTSCCFFIIWWVLGSSHLYEKVWWGGGVWPVGEAYKGFSTLNHLPILN